MRWISTRKPKTKVEKHAQKYSGRGFIGYNMKKKNLEF